jgi:hypothetical protein
VSEPALTWSQPHAFQRRYELRSANELVGELRFPGLFAAKARAILGPDVWDIWPEGLRHGQVFAARAGHHGAEVTFTRHWLWSGGSLDFRAQAPLRVRIRRLRRQLVMETRDGERVLSLQYRGIMRSRGELRFGPRATSYEPNVLAVLAWYLVVTGLFQSGADWPYFVDSHTP